VRAALYFPAIVAKQHNPVIRAFCARLAARGLAPKAVIGAAMRKLLHLAYGMLKSGQPFDPARALQDNARSATFRRTRAATPALRGQPVEMAWCGLLVSAAGGVEVQIRHLTIKMVSPGAADRWRDRWGLAPAPLGPEDRHHS
jgi:hypothetical protein